MFEAVVQTTMIKKDIGWLNKTKKDYLRLLVFMQKKLYLEEV